MRWLEANDADVALLDVHLLDGSCAPVARRLTEKGIPFVVFSGSSPNEEALDPAFAAGAWLEKPASADRIVAAVRGALRA
jgi:DNA-binding response OmpR family regulator